MGTSERNRSAFHSSRSNGGEHQCFRKLKVHWPRRPKSSSCTTKNQAWQGIISITHQSCHDFCETCGSSRTGTMGWVPTLWHPSTNLSLMPLSNSMWPYRGISAVRPKNSHPFHSCGRSGPFTRLRFVERQPSNISHHHSPGVGLRVFCTSGIGSTEQEGFRKRSDTHGQ